MFFRNFYPEKLSKDRVPNIHILVRCGIGDIYTFLTRIPSLKKEYPESRIYFHVGGWDCIPRLIAEVLKPYRCIDGIHLLEGYVGRSDRRMKRMIRFIESKAMKGDIILNWIPLDTPLQYQMQLPFSPSVFPEDEKRVSDFFNEKKLRDSSVIAIHPISTKGNANSFEEARFLNQEKWKIMTDHLVERGHKLLLIGAKGEEHGLVVDEKNIFSFQGSTVRETIFALTQVSGILSTNSWTWEVAAYCGLPASVIWGVNYHHLPLHIPEDKPLSNVQFETDMNANPREIASRFLQLLS